MASEYELVQLSRRGDLDAFAELVRRYQDELVNFVAKFTGSPDDAEDIAQEAFLKAYTRLESFESRAKFKTWLFRIATNHCIDRARKSARRPAHCSLDQAREDSRPLVETLAAEREPLDELRTKELQLEVRKAIVQLPEKLRAVLILHDLQGMQYAEIAQVLGCPVGTVKSRLHNARAQLKERLKAYVNVGESL